MFRFLYDFREVQMRPFELDKTQNLISRVYRIVHLIMLLLKIIIVRAKVHPMVIVCIKTCEFRLRVMDVLKVRFV